MLNTKEIAERTFTPEMAADKVAGRFLTAAHDATGRAEDARLELFCAIEVLRDELDRALAALRKGEAVDALGVCQGKAQAVDRLCAELHMASTIAGRIQMEAQRAGLLPQ